MSRVRCKKISTGRRLRADCDPPLLIRFLRRITVQPDTGCWLWGGHRDTNGYGQVKVRGVAQWAHRFSYAAFVRTIPPGREIDHRCRNSSCVNPKHLRCRTPIANAMDGVRHQNRFGGDVPF